MHITEDQELFTFVIAIAILFTFGGYKYRREGMNFIKNVFEKDRKLGTLLLIMITTVGTVFLTPMTPYNILAAYLYSPLYAFLVCLISHAVAASACFFISRKYAPKFIKDKLNDLKLFKLLSKKDNLTSRQWIELTTLTRASPNFPYAPISYLWGFTNISFTDFLIGTVIGTIPYLVLELYLIYSAGDLITGKYNYHVIIGIVVTIVISYIIDRYVNKLLKEKTGPGHIKRTTQ